MDPDKKLQIDLPAALAGSIEVPRIAFVKKPINVIVWNEFRHERRNPAVQTIYPDGMHEVIAAALRAPPLPVDSRPLQVTTATLEEPEHGLSEARLADCDVLIWWGHKAHAEVDDVVVERVQRRVLGGMGLIVLHAAHLSKIFRRLMGTACTLQWRVAAEKERLWVVEPAHPIAAGLDEHIELPHEEMYGEPFDIPRPDSTVLISWFAGGEVFRSGCCWQRGRGRVFYFRPGHELYPTYHHPAVQRVLVNAVRWAAPEADPVAVTDRCPLRAPLENLDR